MFKFIRKMLRGADIIGTASEWIYEWVFSGLGWRGWVVSVWVCVRGLAVWCPKTVVISMRGFKNVILFLCHRFIRATFNETFCPRWKLAPQSRQYPYVSWLYTMCFGSFRRIKNPRLVPPHNLSLRLWKSICNGDTCAQKSAPRITRDDKPCTTTNRCSVIQSSPSVTVLHTSPSIVIDSPLTPIP